MGRCARRLPAIVVAWALAPSLAMLVPTPADATRPSARAMAAEAARYGTRMQHVGGDEDDGGARAVYLILRLGERRLYLMEGDEDGGGRRVDSFPVAVGRQEYETPTGRFEVVEKIANPDFLQIDWNEPSRVIRTIAPGPDNPLGLRWIGFTSAHGWGIGFHGTPQPELLGRAVSHGCVRMRNSDVVKVYGRVRIGTPVIVER
jgi:lipoprotein-anchoring transpeptidase ErfK/SrfK